MFAILRTEKHNSLAAVGRRASHHLRAHQVPNADAARSHKNDVYGPQTPAAMVQAFRDLVEPLVRRKDNVRCIEVLLTASPEWFKAGEGQAGRLKRAAVAFLKQEFGEANIIGAGVHMDESSPHVWAMVAPIVKGKLNAKALLGSPARLSALQDRWAMVCKPLGLQRGVKRSGARHTSVRTYYAAANGHQGAQLALERESRRRVKRIQAEASRAVQVRDQAMAEAGTALAIARAMPAAQRALLQETVRQEQAAAEREVKARITRPASTGAAVPSVPRRPATPRP